MRSLPNHERQITRGQSDNGCQLAIEWSNKKFVRKFLSDGAARWQPEPATLDTPALGARALRCRPRGAVFLLDGMLCPWRVGANTALAVHNRPWRRGVHDGETNRGDTVPALSAALTAVTTAKPIAAPTS